MKIKTIWVAALAVALSSALALADQAIALQGQKTFPAPDDEAAPAPPDVLPARPDQPQNALQLQGPTFIQPDQRARAATDRNTSINGNADLSPPRRPQPQLIQQQDPLPVPHPQRQTRSGPAYLGVSFDPRTPNAAVVIYVRPGGPADQAGLQTGDMIVAINNERVGSPQDVIDIVRSMRAGDRMDIDFSRRLTNRTQAVLGAGETSRTAAYPPEPQVENRDRSSQTRRYDQGQRSTTDRNGRYYNNNNNYNSNNNTNNGGRGLFRRGRD